MTKAGHDSQPARILLIHSTIQQFNDSTLPLFRLRSSLHCNSSWKATRSYRLLLDRREGQGEESISSLGLQPLGCGLPFSEICGAFPLRPLRPLREAIFISVNPSIRG